MDSGLIALFLTIIYIRSREDISVSEQMLALVFLQNLKSSSNPFETANNKAMSEYSIGEYSKAICIDKYWPEFDKTCLNICMKFVPTKLR